MLLLDTCALLWLNDDADRLSGAARDAITANAGKLFISAISAFEIGIKCRKGSLSLPKAPDAWFDAALTARGIEVLDISWRVALLSTQLPPLHSDPCDRIIVATAQVHGLKVVTPDPLIKAYPTVNTIW